MTATTFEVLAFRALPGPAAVAVLVLDGRFAAAAPRGLGHPRLVVETGSSRVECEPIAGSRQPDAAAGPGGVPWSAAFAAPLATIDQAGFALAVGRNLLFELPAPDLGERDDDATRLARLAREANELRRRIHDAVDRAAAAEQVAEQAVLARRRAEEDAARARSARDEAVGAIDGVRRERDEALAAAEHARRETDRELVDAGQEAARAMEAVQADADRQLAAARAEAERQVAEARADAERQIAESRADAEGQIAEARARTARERDEAVAVARARADAARRELQVARGEVESVRREAARPRRAAAREPQTAPTAAAAMPAREPRTEPQRVAPPDGAGETVPTATGETVRVISSPRRRRHLPEHETEPSELSPGAAQIGARFITPAEEHRGLDPQRIVALVALAIAFGVFVLVVVLGVGRF